MKASRTADLRSSPPSRWWVLETITSLEGISEGYSFSSLLSDSPTLAEQTAKILSLCSRSPGKNHVFRVLVSLKSEYSLALYQCVILKFMVFYFHQSVQSSSWTEFQYRWNSIGSKTAFHEQIQFVFIL